MLEPLAYARVVERIGNEDNVIAIDFEDVIPRHVQMTVSVSASTTDGQALPPDELRKVMDACALAQQLEADRTKLHHFVGSRMALVAPNLSAVCGAEIAAKLVGAAGGLVPLSNMPACNIQVRSAAALCVPFVSLGTGTPSVTAAPCDLCMARKTASVSVAAAGCGRLASRRSVRTLLSGGGGITAVT